jgi:hypothetical protein
LAVRIDRFDEVIFDQLTLRKRFRQLSGNRRPLFGGTIVCRAIFGNPYLKLLP